MAKEDIPKDSLIGVVAGKLQELVGADSFHLALVFLIRVVLVRCTVHLWVLCIAVYSPSGKLSCHPQMMSHTLPAPSPLQMQQDYLTAWKRVLDCAPVAFMYMVLQLVLLRLLDMR